MAAAKAESRHIKIFSIDVEAFLQTLANTEKYPISLISGIPCGVRVVGSDLDTLQQRVAFLLEHESFEEVPFGAVIPEVVLVVHVSVPGAEGA